MAEKITELDDMTVDTLLDRCQAGDDITVFAAAMGAYALARRMGWKPVSLIYSRKTIAKYEKLLGIDFKVSCPEVGQRADKSMAWHHLVQVQEKLDTLWKYIRRELPVENARDARQEST
jgi:hypothetical protein